MFLLSVLHLVVVGGSITIGVLKYSATALLILVAIGLQQVGAWSGQCTCKKTVVILTTRSPTISDTIMNQPCSQALLLISHFLLLFVEGHSIVCIDLYSKGRSA